MNPGNPSSPTVATITVPQMDNSLPSPSATPVPAAIPVVNVEMPQAAKTAEPDNGSSKSNKKESGGCMSCEGKGSCYWCNGSGKCDRCNGTGEYNEGSCTMCSGSGKCNSCGGDGTCMWCKGSGNNLPRRNDVYTA